MDQYLSRDEKIRYDLPDSVRGICILGMVVYHTLFDINILADVQPNAGVIRWVDMIRDFGAAAFIFIAGFCFHFGSHRLRRFLVLSASGIIVSVVTRVVMPDTAVLFGILTFMGVSGGILSVCHPCLCRVPAGIGCVVSFLLFAVFFNAAFGYLGFFGINAIPIPQVLYRNYVTAFFGFPFPGFSSGDYYPLVPWFFICLTGYYCNFILLSNRKATGLLRRKIPVFSWIGKYSLPIYLLHQPVIFGIIFCCLCLMGRV